MTISGTVYHKAESVLGTLEITTGGQYQIAELTVNGNVVLRVPLPGEADRTVLAVKIANIINQTGLVSNPVKVDIPEAP